MGAHTRETPGKKYIGIFLFFCCAELKTPVALRISRATNLVEIGCAAGQFVARRPFARLGNGAFQVRNNIWFTKLTSRLRGARMHCGSQKIPSCPGRFLRRPGTRRDLPESNRRLPHCGWPGCTAITPTRSIGDLPGSDNVAGRAGRVMSGGSKWNRHSRRQKILGKSLYVRPVMAYHIN